jgi:MFS family permease
MDPLVSSLILNAITIFSTFVTPFLADRVGRRVVLLVSGTGMAISVSVLGGYFKYASIVGSDVAGSRCGWLPLGSLVIYFYLYLLGFASMPWVMVSEMSPLKSRAFAGSVSGTVNGLCAFGMAMSFTPAMTAMNTYGVFWMFAVITTISIVFIFFFVPETKKKTLEEIEEYFRSGRTIYLFNKNTNTD